MRHDAVCTKESEAEPRSSSLVSSTSTSPVGLSAAAAAAAMLSGSYPKGDVNAVAAAAARTAAIECAIPTGVIRLAGLGGHAAVLAHNAASATCAPISGVSKTEEIINGRSRGSSDARDGGKDREEAPDVPCA